MRANVMRGWNSAVRRKSAHDIVVTSQGMVRLGYSNGRDNTNR